MNQLPHYSADEVFGSITFAQATQALERAVSGGLDPAEAAPRTIVDVTAGQLLLMPAETASAVGVKIASVAPENPGHGLDRIQALYLLIDAETLTPRALLDGTALTTLRTPAMSAVAIDHLARADASTLVVFGSGPQAWGHVHAARAVRPISSVLVVARSDASAERLVTRLHSDGVPAQRGTADAVRHADIIACTTTAREPLFDGALVADGACVVAVGSHEPRARELDAALLARSFVAVEDAATALREAGDVIMAIAEGAIDASTLVPIAELLARPGAAAAHSGPRVFKSVGQGWQDLVVATAVADALTPRDTPR